MVADSLIDVVNWVIQNFIYPLFPTNFPLLSYNSYNGILASLKTDFVFSFSIISKFLPITLLFTFLGVMLVAELVLVGIKIGIFFLNLVRGSGA
jgi:hypothetical protein